MADLRQQFDSRSILGKKVSLNKLKLYTANPPYTVIDPPTIKPTKHVPFRRPTKVQPGEEYEDQDLEQFTTWIKRNRSRLPRWLFTIVCLTVAMYQTYLQVMQYISYPTGVNVLVDEPKSMRETLPGVTLCTTNK